MAKTKKKPGRPTFVLDDKAIAQIETMAGYGLTMPMIAAVLGCSERTLRKKKGDEERVNAAFELGKAKAQALVGEALFKKAKTGDVPAIKWWEMTRAGRSEKQDVHVVRTHEEALEELD
jgi:AraC-like DNA-binding protein